MKTVSVLVYWYGQLTPSSYEGSYIFEVHVILGLFLKFISSYLIMLITVSDWITSTECRMQVFPAINALLCKDILCNRRFGTLAESNKVVAYSRELEGGNIEPDSNSTKTISSSVKSEDKLKHEVKSSLKISTRHDLAMVFTCKVCETRNMKTASRESYEKGVVVARCGGCNNLHLIADRLGWFGEPGSIEDFLAAQGQEVKRGSPETLNLTLEDLAGRKLDS